MFSKRVRVLCKKCLPEISWPGLAGKALNTVDKHEHSSSGIDKRNLSRLLSLDCDLLTFTFCKPTLKLLVFGPFVTTKQNLCQLGQQHLSFSSVNIIFLIWKATLEDCSRPLPSLCSPSRDGDGFSSCPTVHVSANSRHTVSLRGN